MLVLAAASITAIWAANVAKQAASWEGQPAAGTPRFEVERRKLATTQRASGMSVAERVTLTLQRCDLVVIRSCLEWEPESVPLLATLRGKPVVPLGLLPPSPEGGCGVVSKDGKDATLI